MALEVIYSWLGEVPYRKAEGLQKALVEQVISDGKTRGYLLALEHPHVVTLGRSSSPEHVLVPPERLKRMGVEVVETRRGGDVTYHGPGQLVVYPILPLERLKPDVHWFLRMLEEAGIRTLGSFGVKGARKEGLTGVWVGKEKVMAVGVALRRWVTFHGAALNVSCGLEGFDWIVPCGIEGRGVTSMERLVGGAPLLPEAAGIFAGHLADAFGFSTVEQAGEELWRVPSLHG